MKWGLHGYISMVPLCQSTLQEVSSVVAYGLFRFIYKHLLSWLAALFLHQILLGCRMNCCRVIVELKNGNKLSNGISQLSEISLIQEYPGWWDAH